MHFLILKEAGKSEHTSCKRTYKHYPKFRLQDITFTLKWGRIMGLIGKNGAGKTTTLKSLLNLVHPDRGYVEMFGQDFHRNEKQCKQKIGVVLGGVDFTCIRNCPILLLLPSGFIQIGMREHTSAILIPLSSITKRVKELSAGMRVKYMIALALSHHAELLIFDEPTSGLDPVSRDDLLHLFRQLVKTGERSILFSTHITSDLDKCADDITYIKDGTLLKSAEKFEFIQSFQHLRRPDEKGELTLEEIMIRTERSSYDV